VPAAGPRRRNPPPRSLDRSNKCYLFGSRLLRIEKCDTWTMRGEAPFPPPYLSSLPHSLPRSPIPPSLLLTLPPSLPVCPAIG
jgi:hypothetical protein